MPRKRKPSAPFDLLIGFIALLWVVEIVNLLLHHQLCRYGILPRTVRGLVGIPLSPFLHGSLPHLFVNTGPLAVLGGLVLMNGRKVFVRTTVTITLAGGLGIWLVGRPAVHVGASALVFGWFGFLLANGLTRREAKPIFLALAAVAAYGGLFWGMLPTATHVSWEGHVCGFAAGILAARLGGRKSK